MDSRKTNSTPQNSQNNPNDPNILNPQIPPNYPMQNMMYYPNFSHSQFPQNYPINQNPQYSSEIHNLHNPGYPNFLSYPDYPNFTPYPGYPNSHFTRTSVAVGSSPVVDVEELVSNIEKESQLPHLSTQDEQVIPEGENDSVDGVPTKKPKKWLIAEDELLLHCVLNTSKDSIRGTSQKYDTYWGAITKMYNEKRWSNPRRGLNSL